jgi:hypothetical protein
VLGAPIANRFRGSKRESIRGILSPSDGERAGVRV